MEELNGILIPSVILSNDVRCIACDCILTDNEERDLDNMCYKCYDVDSDFLVYDVWEDND